MLLTSSIIALKEAKQVLMIISYKHKSIFFHNPKTAGSTINHRFFIDGQCEHDVNHAKVPFIYPFLSDSNRHFSPNDYHNKLFHDPFAVEVFDTFFTFSFVRNPYDKLLSLYCYLQQKPWGNREKFVKNHPDFKGWVRTLFIQYKSEKHHNPSAIQGQSQWTHRDGKQVVDFVGRFEDFENEFKIIADRIGLKYEQSTKSNITKHSKYQDYYDEVTKQRAYKMFEEDLDLYKYTF